MRVITTTVLALVLTFCFSAQAQITATGSAQALKLPTKFKATFALISSEKSAYKAWKEVEKETESIVEDFNLEKHIKNIDLGETTTAQVYNKSKGLYMYSAQKLIIIEADSLGVFEDLVKDLLKADFIQLQNLELVSSSSEQTQQNLIGLAIDDARAKALEMAKSAGVKLGAATKIDVISPAINTTFIRADKLTEYQGLKLNKMHVMAKVQVSFSINE